MKPTKINHQQSLLFEQRLSQLLNPRHSLYILSELIDWEDLENYFSNLFIENVGAPAKPVRLVTGLLMLEHMFNLSDETVVQFWSENPYWQFFCGFDYLQWKFPINPSSLSKWRKRIGETGMLKILACTLKTALNIGAVQAKSLKKVIVDTTVMPKNIAYPTDSKLYYRSIEKLVKMAKNNDIELRQTYSFLSKNALRKSFQYSHARQMKRALKERKRLKTYLGRVKRDVERKILGNKMLNAIFAPTLKIVEEILSQDKNSKNKVYSIHEPDVKCISKGKVHKKYEFGCKASIVLTHKEGFILGSEALEGNPYDGHTLKQVIENAEKISNKPIERIFVDKGYKGHNVVDREVFISGQRKGVTSWMKLQIKRRSAIEPHIGHMKNDGKLGRNYLKGILGDKLNAILCGAGHNLRLIIRKISHSEQYQLSY
jgi:IS5 family transposase